MKSFYKTEQPDEGRLSAENRWRLIDQCLAIQLFPFMLD